MKDLSIKIVSNSEDSSVENVLKKLTAQAEHISLAVAYIGRNVILDQILASRKSLRCLVALKYPTDPRVLDRVLERAKDITDLRYLGGDFHSKIYMFSRAGRFFAAIIGSSNMTGGGLGSNIETNLLVRDEELLRCIGQHFKELFEQGGRLDYKILKSYWQEYDKVIKRAGFILHKHDRQSKNKKVHPARPLKSRLGKDYLDFKDKMEKLAEAVKKQTATCWPTVPIFGAIDGFWHWLKNESGYRGKKSVSFRRYFSRFTEGSNTPDWWNKHAAPAKKYCSKKMIKMLTSAQAWKVYRDFHSGERNVDAFTDNNNIGQIRRTWNFLLHDDSGTPMEERLDRCLVDPELRLNRMGRSALCTLLGYVRSNEYPVMNKKALWGITRVKL